MDEAVGLENLYQACVAGQIDKVQSILGLNPQWIAARLGTGGWTPLMVAAFNQRLELVRWLLESGNASISETNSKGTTVLMYAKTRYKERGDFALLDYLFSRGADINAKDAKGLTVSDYVRSQGDHYLLDYLKKHGAH